MVKSIIMCLFQMRDLKVFCNYWGFFTIFCPKRYTGFKGLLYGLELGPNDLGSLGSQISQKRSSSFFGIFVGLAHQSAS